MTKKEKLETRIRNSIRNVSLDDFEALINVYGNIKMGSKHAKARIGKFTLVYKRANPMPPEYVIDLLDILDNTLQSR